MFNTHQNCRDPCQEDEDFSIEREDSRYRGYLSCHTTIMGTTPVNGDKKIKTESDN